MKHQPCDACHDDGVLWPATHDGDNSMPWAERCDACMLYGSDIEAAQDYAEAQGLPWGSFDGYAFIFDPYGHVSDGTTWSIGQAISKTRLQRLRHFLRSRAEPYSDPYFHLPRGIDGYPTGETTNIEETS